MPATGMRRAGEGIRGLGVFVALFSGKRENHKRQNTKYKMKWQRRTDHLEAFPRAAGFCPESSCDLCFVICSFFFLAGARSAASTPIIAHGLIFRELMNAESAGSKYELVI